MQQSTRRSRHHRSRVTRVALAATASALASAGLAAPALASQQPSQTTYNYTTVINRHDTTFNQLLGINNHNVISGYFGSGAQGHPNQGYLTSTAAANAGLMDLGFLPENAPDSVQTQVTGLNDNGVTVGFWSDMNNLDPATNNNYGFYTIGGRALTVNFPTKNNSTPPVNQLLGVNDSNIAAGFYNDANGNSHGYTYDITTRRFHEVRIPGATSVTAAAINNRNDIAGFETDSNGNVDGYLLTRTGHLTVLDAPGATETEATGVNDHREVVGFYMAGGNTYGFTWTAQNGFQTINDPNGIGTTTVNGVNDAGDLVGFYTDSNNNVDGMLATP
jgi:hypothetical protein